MTVGHTTDLDAGTGCTVVLGPPGGMRAAAYIRGRAAGTRAFDALSPRHLVPRIDALLFTGGSAYGLGAADGVMRWLRERGRGFPVGEGVVPIVPSAVVFDLGLVGANDTWPGPDDGYAACVAAQRDFAEGSVGAGTGATVGKALGLERAMKGGVGTWALRQGEAIVGALAVVNAFGDVRDHQGDVLAGARAADGFADARAALAAGAETAPRAREDASENTTLVVVGTNAMLSRAELAEVALSAADGLARRIAPVGTVVDGDVVVAVSVGETSFGASLTIELLAQDAVEMAIERAVRTAVGTAAVPGLADPS